MGDKLKTDKTLKPETPGQARAWQKNKKRYLQAGLCHTCAAQAAWGHQVGFSFRSSREWPEQDRKIKPPCPECATIVANFPEAAAEGSQWRKLPKRKSEGPTDQTHKITPGKAVGPLRISHTPR